MLDVDCTELAKLISWLTDLTWLDFDLILRWLGLADYELRLPLNLTEWPENLRRKLKKTGEKLELGDTADLIEFGSRKSIHNSFTNLTFLDKYALAIYLFLYLEFHNEFATTPNQLCYSKYLDEFLMTIVQSCCDYGICNVLLFWIFWFSFVGGGHCKFIPKC